MPVDRPNIVYIMADDHGANAISAYQSRLASVFQTPQIDRIGAEGALLTSVFCANAICTPSRATILTGQHSHVNGVKTLADVLDVSRTTYPQLLQAAGYQTAVVGKWHVHSEPQGFDYYDVLPGQGRYRDPVFIDQSVTGWSDWNELVKPGGARRGVEHQGHVTDVITEKSLDWLRRRDPSKPFLLMCHHKAPHDHFEYQERHEHLFDGVDIPEPDSLWEDRSHRSEASRCFGASVSERNPVQNMVQRMSRPDYPTGRLDLRGLDAKSRTQAVYQKYLKDYLRTVKGIDDSVGEILDYLDAAGLADDTVVIYTSDQGMFLGEHDYIDKRWIYEEALRMPFLIRYPAKIRAGMVVDDLVGNVDFAPTILDLAGLPAPAEMQGGSVAPLLRGEAQPDRPQQIYYRYWMHLTHHDNPAHFGLRTDRYKLIFFYGRPLDANGAVPEPTPPGWELYDLQEDPEELRNVYGDPGYADVVAALKRQLAEARAAVGDDDAEFPEVAALLAGCP